MTVVISGASRGIGKAIAGIFAANGYNLLLCARDQNTLGETVKELQHAYPLVNINARAADLSNKEEVYAFANWCTSLSVPEIVVNNAGVYQPGSVHQQDDEALPLQMAGNLYSSFYLTRALLPAMLASAGKSKGHIFTICSIASLDAYPNGGAYSVSKFALHGFTKNLREELKPMGIKVTGVYPGAVMTDSWKDFDNSSGRILEATDIAKMVFAASQLSPQACVEDIVIRPQLGDL